jgi:DNA-3-methyladenine glycosylase II
MWGRRPGFPTLVHIILEQQVSLAAARTMFRRISTHLGGLTPEAVERTGSAGLRQLGLTRQKSAYISGLAVALLDRHLDLSALARGTDDAGRQALLALPGIGPWTVDIYYLMALRRPDIWPTGDLALADALQRTLNLKGRPSREEQTRISAEWTPYRSIAARLLWQSYLARVRGSS